jgi:cell division inhibitor SepF
MKSQLRRFANFLGLVDDEYGEYERTDVDFAESDAAPSAFPVQTRDARPSTPPRAARPEFTRPEMPRPTAGTVGSISSRPTPSAPRISVSPTFGRTGVSSFSEDRDVVTIAPTSYNQTNKIVDLLRQNRHVVLLTDAVNPDVARRIVDFTAGVTYSLNAGIVRLSPRAFVISPAGQQLPADFRARLESQYAY